MRPLFKARENGRTMKAWRELLAFLLMGLLVPSLVPQLFAAQAGSPAARADTAAFKMEWDNLVAAAQKEGTITVYGNLPPSVRDKLIAAFKARYGINLELATGRPAELMAKINGERRAGLYTVDIGLFGGTTTINDLIPLKITEPLEPMLVLPEVKHPENWNGGKLPFLDSDKTAMILVMMANSFYQRNVNLVKENEITSSMDLLNPKWKEKIVVSDPSISGASNSWFTWMLSEILGKEKGLQFMQNLVTL